jgi:DMSO reductase anchor subunit
MLLTLPLVLFIVMAEVAAGAVSVLVFLDWRKEVTRGFLILYAIIYLAFTGLTYLFQQGFASPLVLSSYPQLDQAWVGSLSLPLLIFLLLQIPYSLFLILDKHAGIKGQSWASSTGEEEPAKPEQRSPILSVLRYLSGGATVLAGLATIFVMAMIFRPLAAANIGGVFTVAGFFAAAFALGGVLTAMWLGHWYLAASTVSEKPLQFSTAIVLIAILAQIVLALAAGPVTAYANKPTTPSSSLTVTAPASGSQQVKPVDAPTVAPLSSGVIGWLRILVGFVIPLVLGGFIWKLVRDRSFQSATGMLYLIVVCALAGEIMARGLFLGGL